MKKILTVLILFPLTFWSSFAAITTSSTEFKNYLETQMELPSDMITKQWASYTQDLINNDKKFNGWKTQLQWWNFFKTSQSNCPYESLTSKSLQDIQRMNRDIMTVVLGNYLEKSKFISSISPEYGKWLQEHINNIEKFVSYDLCDKIYTVITNYDYHLDKFGHKIDKEYNSAFHGIIAVQSVRKEYREQKITTLPAIFYSDTFGGDILVVSNKKDIKEAWKYKGIIFDQKNRAGRSLRQTFYYPFSPLNNIQDYKLLISKNELWSVNLYKWNCDITNQKCSYPDEIDYVDIKKYLDIKIQKEIWDIYLKDFNIKRKSIIQDYGEKWNYKMGESFAIEKVNNIYFLASKEVKW